MNIVLTISLTFFKEIPVRALSHEHFVADQRRESERLRLL